MCQTPPPLSWFFGKWFQYSHLFFFPRWTSELFVSAPSIFKCAGTDIKIIHITGPSTQYGVFLLTSMQNFSTYSYFCCTHTVKVYGNCAHSHRCWIIIFNALGFPLTLPDRIRRGLRPTCLLQYCAWEVGGCGRAGRMTAQRLSPSHTHYWWHWLSYSLFWVCLFPRKMRGLVCTPVSFQIKIPIILKIKADGTALWGAWNPAETETLQLLIMECWRAEGAKNKCG